MESEDPQQGGGRSGGTAIDDLIARLGVKRIALIALGLCVVVAPPVIWAATRGESGPKQATVGPTEAEATAAGCELHDFEYGVTNDEGPGRAYQREALLGSHPPLPNAGYEAGDKPPALGVVLHTLAHGWLVVKYSDALDAQSKTQLKQFAAGAGRDVAVVPGGPSLSSGFAAIRWGHGLNCADASAEALVVLREFEKLKPKLD